MSNKILPLSKGVIEGVEIACQETLPEIDLFGVINIHRSFSASVFFDLGLFLFLYRCTRVLLKPLRMIYVSQLLAGFLVGPGFDIYMRKYSRNKEVLYTIASILSNIGFILHLFLLGLELNLGKLTKVGKKSCVISFVGFVTSMTFSYATYFTFSSSFNINIPNPLGMALMNASNFLMSTSSHLNDLGISNSKLGQLAASASMITDMTVMLLSISLYFILIPMLQGKFIQGVLVCYYALIFCVFRPIIIYTSSLKHEGRPMKQSHFVVIVLCVFVLALLGEYIDQRFSPFLLALTLPEEPLASVFIQKLDPFATNILFPFYLLILGSEMDLHGSDIVSFGIMVLLIMGYIGKFIGVTIAATFLRLPFSQAITLSLILSAKGVQDFAAIHSTRVHKMIDMRQSTVCILQSATTMLLLPIVKLFYEPSRQYSTVIRQSVLDFQANNETLVILVCIHKEESLSGLLRVLKLCCSSRENPVSIIALQLLQLNGRCTMPIMVPLHEVSSISSLRSNVDRSARIVNSFLYLQRETAGTTHAQHFIAMSPYATMHNDICTLAYEKKVGLVIVPFHASWAIDKKFKDSSLSVREVNNVVLKKAPCAVGVFVDRSVAKNLGVVNPDVYRISIFFVGGADDHEALAYSRLFANHRSVRLNAVWLKPPESEKKDEVDYEIIKEFRKSCQNNERICYKEIIVNDGAETVDTLVSMKDEIDLVVIGRNHDSKATPLLGLSDGWCEYPELGILGDIFASPDFEFLLLVVQQEPPRDTIVELALF